MQALTALMLPFFGHYPTNGMRWHPLEVDAKKIVAANLGKLIDAAFDARDFPVSSQKQLAITTKLGRATIQRALGLEKSTKGKAPAAIGIDVLQTIAEAYELQAWQLLVPHMSPSNPPVVAVTPEEKALTDRLRQVGREFAKVLESTGDGSTDRGTGSDRKVAAKGPAATPARRKRSKESAP